MIGGVGWDPFAVVGTTNDSGSPLSLLNSGSIASPVWGSLLFSPKNPVPYGLTKDLMDYLNRGNGENYWISDFHFQQIFTYNTTNNPAPTP